MWAASLSTVWAHIWGAPPTLLHFLVSFAASVVMVDKIRRPDDLVCAGDAGGEDPAQESSVESDSAGSSARLFWSARRSRIQAVRTGVEDFLIPPVILSA